MDKFGKWPWALLGFILFISSVYQYGFWSVFELNTFQYFDPYSILKNFIYVIMSGINPFFAIIFIMQILDGNFLTIGKKFERAQKESIYDSSGVTTWKEAFKKISGDLAFWPIVSTTISGMALMSFKSPLLKNILLH